MDVSFERSMNHNYMILSCCDFFGSGTQTTNDFRIKMLLENNIQGLLPVTHRIVNGESRYYYEINSLQSLERLYHKNEIKDDELRKILKGCVNLFECLDEYLLDGSQIIIKPEFIYMNVETLEPYFVCYPDYEEDARNAFMEFVDLLLTKIDHNDEKAVMLGYQIYKYTRNPNYVMGEILNIMGREEAKLRKAQEYSREIPQYGTALNMASNVNSVHSNMTSTQTPNFFSESYNTSPCERPLYNISNDDDFTKKSDKKQKKKLNNLINFKKSSKTKTEENTQEVAKTSITKTNSLTEKLKSKRNNTKDDNNTPKPTTTKGEKGYILGIIVCSLIALCSGGLIAGVKAMGATFNQDIELYIYGAFAMSIAAAALFATCIIKGRRHKKEITALQSDTATTEFAPYTPTPQSQIQQSTIPIMPQETTETEFLDLDTTESRILIGFVNGSEVRIPLDRLPLTVGKKSGISDIILDDQSVSRMHARFEEHNGKVCVCDLNSTNGTLRNGEMIDMNRFIALEVGDKLKIGKSCFTYC
jgi:hypothetical protein